MSEAKVRFEVNVAEINSLLAEIARAIKRRHASTKNPDYADAGDLAYLRQRLNEALGREARTRRPSPRPDDNKDTATMSLIRIPDSPYFHVVLIVNGKRYQKAAKTASRAQAKAFESKWHNELRRQAAFGEAEPVVLKNCCFH